MPNRPFWSGPVSYVRSILVRDARGDELRIYEFEDRRFFKKVRRLELDTGELVRAFEDVFVIVATGEKLVRVCHYSDGS